MFLFYSASLKKDSYVILCGYGITFFRCWRSSDDCCVEKGTTIKILKAYSFLNNGEKQKSSSFCFCFSFLCSGLAAEAFWGGRLCLLYETGRSFGSIVTILPDRHWARLRCPEDTYWQSTPWEGKEASCVMPQPDKVLDAELLGLSESLPGTWAFLTAPSLPLRYSLYRWGQLGKAPACSSQQMTFKRSSFCWGQA